MQVPALQAAWKLSWSMALTLLALTGQARATERTEIEFPSEDGVLISADLYLAHEKAPFIVMFHQAGWSRGEYIEIAPRLNKLGFNCMAVDLRSGNLVNFIQNETFRRATEQGKPTTYVDAEQDVLASLKLAREKYAKDTPLLAWGSSYSASLALRVVGENKELADGILAFAPGEYFQNFGKPSNWIRKSAQELDCPVFLTGAKRESQPIQGIADSIATEKKTVYLPETEGNHGSRALWERFEDSPGYWKAVETFLAENFPATKAPPAEEPANPQR